MTSTYLSPAREELAMEKEFTVAPDASVQGEITKLQDMADMYTRKIELERRKVSLPPQPPPPEIQN